MFSFIHLQLIIRIKHVFSIAFLAVLVSTPIFSLEFVTDKDAVTVPEGGTATFQVKLSSQPASNVNVTVSRAAGGDTDITVISGSSLKFTKGNWDNFQEVTLEAAEDGDTTNGLATIRISDDASLIPSTEVIATEQDNDTLIFVTDTDEVTVPEGGIATFRVKLSGQPSSEVNVTVSHVSGDSDISIQSGSNLIFTPETWDEYQEITLQAAEDVDAASDQATIRISGDATVIPDKDITATEEENDTLVFVTDTDTVTVPEGGTATFQVKLSAQPSSNVDVTVSWVNGDLDITVKSGSSLKFSTGNWNNFKTVTLEAAEDADTSDGQATIRISDDASLMPSTEVIATEQDNDTLIFVTDNDEVIVPEGGIATFQVMLSGQPPSDINVTVSHVSGDSDISIQSGSSLTFTTSTWNDFQTVTLAAAEDDDLENGEATILISAPGIEDKEITASEEDDDDLWFVTDKKIVTVPEGATDIFKVKLSGKPPSNVDVTISRASGDTDITFISDSDTLELTFTPEDWNKFQTVTLAAAEDDDVINGEALIQIRAAGVEGEDIIAVEQDNDIADIYLKLNPHTATTGNIIKISIEISNNTQEFNAFGLDFIYESDLFTLKSLKKGSLTSDWNVLGWNELSPGTITIGCAAGGGQAIYEGSKGTLIRIWLKVRCDSFNEITESEVRIEAYSDGIQGFSPEPCTADITLIPCSRVGDVNGDGNLTPGDAQSTLEIYLGKRAPEFCQKTTSDSNGDESTTPGDAQDIFDCYLGKKVLPECHDDGSTGTSSAASFEAIKTIRDKRRQRPVKPRLYPLNTIGYSGKIVNIPIIITNPEGISSFSFEVNYLPELLEYTGIRKSQLTKEFEYVTGLEEIEGLIRVEGESKEPIEYNKYASLAVLEFRVKEGVNGRLPIIVFNPGKDLFNVEIDDGSFFGLEYFDEQERFLSLGKASIMPDRTQRMPVKVSSAFNIKSFGIEIKYPTEKMSFAGINRGELTKDFTAVEGNESEPGVVRVGGYNMSGIQERRSGTLVELVFLVNGKGGKLEIVELVDDIQDFIIQNERIRPNEKRDRVKKLWFPKSYDHR